MNRISPNKNRNAFSILEVILALALLTGAIAILGELGRQGMRNARATQDLSRAQLLCESKLAEFTSGISLPEAVSGTAFDSTYQDSSIAWIYSVEIEQVDQDGLISVRVIVSQELPAAQHPATYSLSRWMIDPTVVAALAAAQQTAAASATSASGASATGSTNGQ